jgi:hypothetical protein
MPAELSKIPSKDVHDRLVFRTNAQDLDAVALDADRPTILLVEDEYSLRIMMHKILQGFGYHVLTASSGTEALHIWEANAGAIDLLLTDMVMEGLTGIQLAQLLRTNTPSLKVVYTSGFDVAFMSTGDEPLIEGKNFVQKPYRQQTLASTIRNALDNQ